jgi:multiple sugar transport system permease protein
MTMRSKTNPGETHQMTYNPMKDTTLMRLFIMPTIILLIAINIFPLLWSLFLSFSNFEAHKPAVWGKNPLMVGTANYLRVLTDPEMWGRFITTAKYVVLSVGGEMLLGFGLALLLQVKFKGRGVITTLLVLPMTMSPVIVGLMWKLFMDPNWGMLNYLLGLDKVQWAQDSKINLYSIVIVDIWTWTPFVMLLSLAGLSAIPEYLYEAAEVDRASWWFKFTRITLPMVYPLLLVALIFRTMEAFKIFDLPMGLVGTGSAAPALVSMRLYILSFLTWKTGFGSSLGYIVLVMIVAISSVFVKYLNKAKQ